MLDFAEAGLLDSQSYFRLAGDFPSDAGAFDFAHAL